MVFGGQARSGIVHDVVVGKNYGHPRMHTHERLPLCKEPTEGVVGFC